MNGGELAVKEATVTFGEKYRTFPTPNRSGCTFLGWFTEEGVPIVGETIVRTAKDLTLYAEWAEITS